MTTLSTDRPLTNPSDDLFGHAPFAKHLANAILRQQGSDGIVLALYGPWGSGKSTVLAYVQHYLDAEPVDTRPVVVSFNPWWFSGQENLVRAFLDQLQVVLPEKYRGFKDIGKKLSDYSDAIGGVVELTVGGLGAVVKAGLKKLAPKSKDVPALKKGLVDLLNKEKKRILVVVDDIDRLAPDEVRQLFTLVKALADFPYVTYLLAFDRQVASEAIKSQTGLPGERYLEKIIQVPFELPVADRVALRHLLTTKLDVVMQATPEGRFDPEHWTNIFHAGVDALIRTPRDVVRLINTLSVTYAAVVGEVNPVDFIAIESIRVFLPSVYAAIRDNEEKFVGYRPVDEHNEKQAAIAFHDAWLSTVPDELRASIKDLVRRLFPKLESIWGNMHYSADSAAEWRRELRVCADDIFPAFFRLSFPVGALTRADLDGLLAASADANTFGTILREAVSIKRSDGLSKARALLERLMDHVERDVPSTSIEPIVQALLDDGDDLLKEGDSPEGAFDFGNESRVTRIIYHLLKRVDKGHRASLIADALVNGHSLRCSQYLLAALNDEADKAQKGQGEAGLLTLDEINDLKTRWVRKVIGAARSGELLEHAELSSVLNGWHHWGDANEIKEWWEQVSVRDEVLVSLIDSFKSYSTSQTFGDYAARRQIRVNPENIDRFGDSRAMAQRLRELLKVGSVPEEKLPAIRQFILECDMIASGKNPDGAFAFDR